MNKRLISALLLIFVAVFGGFTVFSAQIPEFYAEDTAVKNNRIFSVTVNGTGDKILSAAKFDFIFDENSVEFRDITPAYDNARIKYSILGGRLTVIYLNEKGVDLLSGAALFTVDFKAQNLTGDTYVDFNPTDCVDVNAEGFEASGGKCKVTLLSSQQQEPQEKTAEKSASAKAGAKTSKGQGGSSGDGTNSSENGVADNQPQGNAAENSPSERDGFVSVSSRDNTAFVFAAGAVLMFVLVSVCFISYHIGKKHPNNDSSSGKKEK